MIYKIKNFIQKKKPKFLFKKKNHEMKLKIKNELKFQYLNLKK